ncbi:MAG: glycosyltransferase family 2 protein [Acidobacteriota bacterium]
MEHTAGRTESGHAVGSGEPQLSVVAPVYCNQRTLRSLHQRLKEVLAQAGGYEMIFVDDASPDHSLAVLEELSREDRCVRIARLGRHRGQNRALLEGLSKVRGRRIVTLDADLQDPPEAIPWLLEGLEKGVEVVFAGRRGRYESRTRLLWSRLFKTAFHFASGRRIPIDAGLFMAMSEQASHFILDRAGHSSYLLEILARYPGTMVSVPVVRNANPYGESSFSFSKRLVLGIGALVNLLVRSPSGRKVTKEPWTRREVKSPPQEFETRHRHEADDLTSSGR